MWFLLNLIALFLVNVNAITEPNTLSQSDIQQILDKHNELRSKVAKGDEVNRYNQPPAKNMNKLLWDPALAKVSRDYAQKCVFQHNDERGNDLKENKNEATFQLPSSSYSVSVGENIYGTSERPYIENIKSGIQAWYDEIKDYTYSSGACSGVCGHYTQVVWANTRYVGCGFYSCDGSGSYSWMDTIFFCNYYPAGNYYGQKPYEKANNNNEICSNCDSDRNKCDNNGLCSGGVCSSFNANNNQQCNIDDCDDGTGRDICNGDGENQNDGSSSTTPPPQPMNVPTTPSPTTSPQNYYNINIIAHINWETDWTTLSNNNYYVYRNLFSQPKNAIITALNININYYSNSLRWNYFYNDETNDWDLEGTVTVTLSVNRISENEYNSILLYIKQNDYKDFVKGYLQNAFGNNFKVISIPTDLTITNIINSNLVKVLRKMSMAERRKRRRFLIL